MNLKTFNIRPGFSWHSVSSKTGNGAKLQTQFWQTPDRESGDRDRLGGDLVTVPLLSRLCPPLFGAGVLGHGLGALGHGVLGQLAGQQQADGGLDLPGSDGGSLVVMRQARRFSGDALEDVVDKRVHDAHSLRGDPRVRVHLLQHLVHIDGIAFFPALAALFVPFLLRFGHGLFGALLGGRG